MIQMLLLILVAVGLIAFMINRLYVGLSHKQITVKGITYARDRSPIQFWLTMMFATFGLAFGLFIVVIGSVGLLAH